MGKRVWHRVTLRERDRLSKMERKKWGRARHRERNRHQIHCFHCLIRTTERERMKGWGSGGRGGREKTEEEHETAWERFTHIPASDWSLTLKMKWSEEEGESGFVLFKTTGSLSEPQNSHSPNFVYLHSNNSIITPLRLLLFQLSCKHLNQLILLDLDWSSSQELPFQHPVLTWNTLSHDIYICKVQVWEMGAHSLLNSHNTSVFLSITVRLYRWLSFCWQQIHATHLTEVTFSKPATEIRLYT